ncbi:MAG: sulfatase-like hydrolase/transferase [Rhodospirillales bacterium]|nr:sulfatase-like hydrolase/transferase [Rhodospirillales bacterium]
MEPKNLLIVMSDEHNARFMGCAGHELAKTPNLDDLAAGGTRFTSAYSNCPICVPARAIFATGRYTHETGYWDNAIAYDGRVESWGHRLRAAGRRVESIGKLHFRSNDDDNGFQIEHIPMHLKDGVGMVQGSIRGQYPDFSPPEPQRRGGPSIVGSAQAGETSYIKYDRKIAEIACDWLSATGNRGDEAPWVLFVSFVTPHYPLTVPREYLDLYPPADMPHPRLDPADGHELHPWSARLGLANQRFSFEEKAFALSAYLGLCTFMDDQVGRVLAALDAASLRDETRILYTSDHGENAGSRGMWGKSVMYQEATNIPMILSGPDVPMDQICETPVSLVDAYPSVLAATGTPGDGSHEVNERPGRSLFDIANEPADPDRPVFGEYHAMRSPSAAYFLREGRYKYHYYVGFDAELYDLAADPEETVNLAAGPDHADLVARFEAKLRERLDPETTDARAKADQKALVDRHGGPDAVMARLSGGKNYTEVPDEVLAVL